MNQILNREQRRSITKDLKRLVNDGRWGEWEHRFNASHGLPFINGWCNNLFAVQQYHCIGWDRIMCKKHDDSRMVWAELYRIKNELFGEEQIAIEVLPKASKLVDSANMYWFFLIPESEEEYFLEKTKM